MKARDNRLKKLEQQGSPATEPEFISWKGEPWTPEQMAQSIRRYPTAKWFSRPLLPEDAEDQVLRCDVRPKAEPREDGER